MKRPVDPDATPVSHPSPASTKPRQTPHPKASPAPPELPGKGLAVPVFNRAQAVPHLPASRPLPLPVLSSASSDSGSWGCVGSDVADSSALERAAQAFRSRAPKQSAMPSEKQKLQAGISINASRSQVAKQAFLGIIAALGSLSPIGEGLASGRQEHLSRMLSMFAASTVIRYCSAFRTVLSTLEDLKLRLDSITAFELADVLVVMSLARAADPESGQHSATAIKAVRWIHKVLEVASLSVAHSQVIGSFLKSKLPRERKEAVPLSLYVVVQIERRVLSRDCSDAEVLVLGGMLLILWSSLRFMDAQRVLWRSLSYDGHTLRGSCFQTKTSSHGQPFGLLAHGFLSHGAFSWCHRFLCVLDAWAGKHLQLHPHVPLPSSLLLAVDSSGEPLLPLQPMSYAAALRHLRHAILLPWKSSKPPEVASPTLNYTVHSLKTTMLSWAGQRPEVTQVEKLCQGHHRQSSSQLYSREDIIPALRAQMKIQFSVRAGGRFMTPLHRGAQHPMSEPDVALETFSKAVTACSWVHFRHFSMKSEGHLPVVSFPEKSSAVTPSTQPVPLAEIQSEDEASGDSSGDEPQSFGPAEEFVFGSCTNIQHVMVPAQKNQGHPHAGGFIKAACGVVLHADTVQIFGDYNPRLQLCKRRACCLAFGQLDA